MGSLGKELIVFLVIFLVIGFAAIVARIGKKSPDQVNDANNDTEQIEPVSAHSKNRMGKVAIRRGDEPGKR